MHKKKPEKGQRVLSKGLSSRSRSLIAASQMYEYRPPRGTQTLRIIQSHVSYRDFLPTSNILSYCTQGTEDVVVVRLLVMVCIFSANSLHLLHFHKSFLGRWQRIGIIFHCHLFWPRISSVWRMWGGDGDGDGDRVGKDDRLLITRLLTYCTYQQQSNISAHEEHVSEHINRFAFPSYVICSRW